MNPNQSSPRPQSPSASPKAAPRGVEETLRRLLGGADYSPWHRLLEVASVLSFFGLLGAMAWRLGPDISARADHLLWMLPTALPFGFVAADFASGFVHWMGDRFGSPQTPVLGPNFVRPFREHHTDPAGITRHDFLEVNGDNAIVLMLAMIPVFLLLNTDSLFGTWAGIASVCFFLSIFMTNQFHKWAHAKNVSPFIRWLQRRGLILSPEHHAIHHTSPYDTYYCITCGWLNPLLRKLHFFDRAERVICWVLRLPPRAQALGLDADPARRAGT